MPCYEPRGDGYDALRSDAALNDATSRVHQLTQNLCYLCASLQDDGLLDQYSNTRIAAWWAQHSYDDEVRVRKEIEQVIRKREFGGLLCVASVANHMIWKAECVHPVSEWHKNWFYKLAAEILPRILKEKEC